MKAIRAGAVQPAVIHLIFSAACGVLPLSLLASGTVFLAPLFGIVLAAVLLHGLYIALTRRRAAVPVETPAAAEAEARVAELKQRLAEHMAAAAEQRREALNQMAENIENGLREPLSQLTTGADHFRQVADSFAEVVVQSGQNAVMSGEAADHSTQTAQQLADTANHLNAAIQSISEQVNMATGIIGTAVAASDDAKRAIAAASEQADAIQSVVGLIRKIAAQTNMLALNATIEAARAGDAGRGFAVVAKEVKVLAQQTAQSIDSIVSTIGATRRSNREAVEAVDRICGAMVTIESTASAIAAAVDEQRETTSQIAHSIDETVAAAATLSEQIAAITTGVGNSLEIAADGHSTASAVTDATVAVIADFARIVAHAVRTSAPEVNRRAAERYSTELGCTISWQGVGRFDGQVVDVSDTGARVRLMVPTGRTIAPGTRGELILTEDLVNWTGTGLPFETIAAAAADSAGEVRLRFVEAQVDAEALVSNAA